MSVYRTSILGTSNIGIYALTTNKYTILPPETSEGIAGKIKECLKGEIVRTSICGTRLIGVFGVANSNGMILSDLASEEEVTAIKSVLPINIERVESKISAFGNLVLANDHGGVASNLLLREKGLVEKIEEVLDVEVVTGEIAGLPYVGSVAVATNKGVLAHPLLRDEERKLLEEVLKVPINVGTINGGYPWVASGILANDYGVVIGNFTTGPEILIISNTLT